jgi:hypothetical protein
MTLVELPNQRVVKVQLQYQKAAAAVVAATQKEADWSRILQTQTFFTKTKTCLLYFRNKESTANVNTKNSDEVAAKFLSKRYHKTVRIVVVSRDVTLMPDGWSICVLWCYFCCTRTVLYV